MEPVRSWQNVPKYSCHKKGRNHSIPAFFIRRRSGRQHAAAFPRKAFRYFLMSVDWKTTISFFFLPGSLIVTFSRVAAVYVVEHDRRTVVGFLGREGHVIEGDAFRVADIEAPCGQLLELGESG